YRTGAVKEAVEYIVKVAVISAIGAVGEWAQANITPLGKYLIPGDVPSLTVFEAGGRVYGTAGKAIDIDILRYSWRYWPVGGSWAAGTVIDEADALRMISDTIPVGTWIIGVKAIDSVRQESANARTATVVVTSDANSFFVDSYESNAPTLTNMVAYKLTREDPNTYYVTDDGVSWDSKFPNAMDTYVNPLFTYHASVTSSWLGEGEDFGQLLGGNWSGEAVVSMLTGSYTSAMGFSTNGSAYAYLAGLSHKTNARFARLKHEALTTSTMVVTVPGQTIRLDAVPRTEIADFVTSATVPTLIQLENTYSAAKKIVPMLEGATARTASYDRVMLAPVMGLQMTHEVTGTDNPHLLRTISTALRTVQSGDYLEFDIFFASAAALTDITRSGVWLKGPAMDISIEVGAEFTLGGWISVKGSLSAIVGLDVSTWILYHEADGVGKYSTVWRDIRVTDGAGVVRQQIYSSGEPSANANYGSYGITNQQCGPANSLQIRAFNASDGVQISSNGKLEFQGV
ncbi:MAG: hypothetical protein WA108_09740, partial [Thiobacillus sp.]